MAWWLTPRTPDPEVGVRATLGSPFCVLEQDIFTPPPQKKKKKKKKKKILVIPRKRWLRAIMTKNFTGTLSIKLNQNLKGSPIVKALTLGLSHVIHEAGDWSRVWGEALQ